jgi:BASS family bile acid:Na+ symporter
MKYSIIGVLGAFLASVVLAPLMVGIFAGSDDVNTWHLFFLMLWMIIVPMLVSRILLFKKILPVVAKIRGKVVDWGFAIIIYTAVGLNRDVFFSDFKILLLSTLVLFISVFLLGSIYEYAAKKILHNRQIIMSQTLLVTVKSSGVSVVMALSLFGTRAAIPSAIMAVFVLLYLLYLSFRIELKKRK